LQRKTIKLAFKAAFTPGYIGKLFDRSSLAHKNGVMSLSGVIDPDYRGEWGIILYNSTPHTFEFKAGDRIGQVVFWKVEAPEVSEVSSLEDTQRGEGGYGSTGK
jgi:dUTP pyrophosphatase